MIEQIYTALFSDLQCFADENSLPCGFTNVDFAPTGDFYIFGNVLFAATGNEGMGIVNQPGIFQVDVAYRDGRGVIASAQIADLLIDRYARNSRINADDPLGASNYCIAFNQRGYVAPPVIGEGWLKMSVNFNFRILI